MVTFVKEFENYLLSDHPEEELRNLILGSDSEVYLNLIKLIKQISHKKKIDQELKAALSRAYEKLPHDTYKQTKILTLLKEFDLGITIYELNFLF